MQFFRTKFRLLPGRKVHISKIIDSRQPEYIPIPRRLPVISFQEYANKPTESKKYRSTIMVYQHNKSFCFNFKKNKIIGEFDLIGTKFHEEYLNNWVPDEVKEYIERDEWVKLYRSPWYDGQGHEFDYPSRKSFLPSFMKF